MNTTDLTPLPERPNLEQFKKQAKELLAAVRAYDSEARKRFQGFHPEGRKLDTFALADAQLVLAREHGFLSWPKFAAHLEGLARADSPVSLFEQAADAIVTGDEAALRTLLGDHPDLVRERSPRVHRAALIHYIAANGLENYRQKTPPNAVAIARMLLEGGAEPDAFADMYGSAKATPLDLLVSSVWPSKAGLHAALVDVLIDHGAKVNGTEDNGSPIVTAIAHGYPEAIDALVRRGARIDNVIAAAGAGDEAALRSMLDGKGGLREGVPLARVEWLRVPADAKTHLGIAISWAGKLGRVGALRVMLESGVDPGLPDHNKFTALHWAAGAGNVEVVELLLQWNAPLEVENEYGGTVFDSTMWFVHNSPPQPGQPRVLQMLIDAGAFVDPFFRRPSTLEQLPGAIAKVLSPGFERSGKG